MFPNYEAMAESLEQFKFPEYPDDLFIQLPCNKYLLIFLNRARNPLPYA